MRINNINTETSYIKKSNKTEKFGDGRAVLSKFANDSLLSTLSLEIPCDVGRGANALKRGGFPEFRERATEDIVSAVFWMKGVDMFNALFDWAGKHILKLPTTKFDVGKDALRTPFENVVQTQSAGMSEEAAQKLAKKLSVFKFSKVVTSAILAAGFMGFVVPKLNQAITRKLMNRKKIDEPVFNDKQPQNKYDFPRLSKNTPEDFEKRISQKSAPSFKGLGLTRAAYLLENHPIWKMVASDVGMITGRYKTARNKDEGREYVFRDVASSFFYYASVPLIYKGFQTATNTSELTGIDAVCSKMLHDNISETVKNAGGTLKAEEFVEKTAGVLSEASKELMSKMPFESDVVALSEIENVLPEKLLERAKEMAKLQPAQAKKGFVLTKQQVADVLKNGSINTPEFMLKTYTARFKDDLTDASKYIPMKKITAFRDNMDKYIEKVKQAAIKENGGIVDERLLNKLQKKGFAYSSIFRIIAITVSALALGVIIPKVQYAITKAKTGSAAAPGLREYENDK